MDVSTFQAQLQAEGDPTPVCVSPPAGYRMDEHAHDFDACALITAGEFSITVQGECRRYGVGDVFRLPAGTVHAESAGEQGAQYLAGRRSKWQA
jgi:quercetin dioxygenase-like cupin family protein